MRAAEQAVQAADPWLAAVRAAVADPAVPELHVQPIVDLVRAEIAGYEVLSRFPGPPDAPPDHWFAVADRAGLSAHLEARVLRRALGLRSSLPHGTFLAVNVSPHLLGAEPVVEVLADAGSLTGTVIELSGRVPDDMAELARSLERVTSVGGLVAVDDAGAGHRGMTQIATLRPALVKLDRSLVSGIDADPTKTAVVEMLGEYASRMDAWLLAEGVETEAELEALMRLGVPLGQGFLLGRPALPWPALRLDVIDLVRRAEARPGTTGRIGSLVEEAERVAVNAPDQPHTGQVLVEVDRGDRPMAMRHATGATPRRTAVPSLLVVLPSERVEQVARKAIERAAPYRFEPLVCADVAGRLLGVVRMERLVAALADTAGAAAEATEAGAEATEAGVPAQAVAG
jgi:EAL domain-containing protein (putative c-di-GMP-specific phosphodiesterase class I)